MFYRLVRKQYTRVDRVQVQTSGGERKCFLKECPRVLKLVHDEDIHTKSKKTFDILENDKERR